MKLRLALLLEVEKAIPIPEMVTSRQVAEMKLQATDKPLDLSTKNKTRWDQNEHGKTCTLCQFASMK